MADIDTPNGKDLLTVSPIPPPMVPPRARAYTGELSAGLR